MKVCHGLAVSSYFFREIPPLYSQCLVLVRLQTREEAEATARPVLLFVVVLFYLGSTLTEAGDRETRKGSDGGGTGEPRLPGNLEERGLAQVWGVSPGQAAAAHGSPGCKSPGALRGQAMGVRRRHRPSRRLIPLSPAVARSTQPCRGQGPCLREVTNINPKLPA